MKGNNFFYHNVPVVCILPQTIAGAATVNGADIPLPWRIGRQITFILAGGDIPGTITAATFKVQGKLISTGSYEDVKDAGGTNNLVFTAAKTIDAGELDSGVLMGTIPFTDINFENYSAIRLVCTTTGTGNYLISAVGIISDLFTFPGSKSDDLFAKVRG